MPISPPSQSSFLYRIAAARPPRDEDTGMSKARMGAIGVAAASPFLGLLGERPIINDPLKGAKGQDFATIEDLQQHAQPGDVLLMGKDKGSKFKTYITPSGGSEFYHAQPVTSVRNGIGRTLSAGDLHESVDEAGVPLNRDTWGDWDFTIKDYVDSSETGYKDVALLRPKQPLTEEQLAVLRREHGDRVLREYDSNKALSTFFRNTFVPKWDWLNKNRPETICEGNVCSTMPAQAYYEATGRSIVPGKRAQDVFPTDFMRTNEFELVGSHISPETRAAHSKLSRKMAPWLLRGGLGAGLAGATYGVTESPETAAGILGAAAAENELYKLTFNNKVPWINSTTVPTYWGLGDTIASGGLSTPEGRALVGKVLTRRVPVALAGGALAYGGARAAHAGYDRLKARLEARSK